MGIDLRLLRSFTSTVDEGSVNRAATVLHITQPALSRQVKQLELQVGVALFERSGRSLRLTRAGEEFLPSARELLGQADSLERTAASIAAGHLERFHLAVPATTLTDVLAPFLATLDERDPLPIVRELDPVSAQAALRNGADLVISTLAPSKWLASRPIAVLPVWAYVPAGDEWAKRLSIELNELIARPLVLLPESFRPRQLLEAAITSKGLTYGAAVVDCGNAQVAQALSAAGRGVAVVSDDPRFGLVPLRIKTGDEILRISLFAAWNPAHHAADRLDAIAQRLGDFCVSRYGSDVAPTVRLVQESNPKPAPSSAQRMALR